jgi:hypothetical protein
MSVSGRHYEESSRPHTRPRSRPTASVESPYPFSSSSPHHIPTTNLYPNSIGTNHQSTIENRSEARDDSTNVSLTDEHPNINTHTLRSTFQYHHLEDYSLRPVKLYKAFNDAYIPFRDGRPIPQVARETLSGYTLTSQQYYSLVTNRELPCGRYIYLDGGKIMFDEWTMPPHAEVIIEIAEQIAVQNRNRKLFQGGTGGSLSNCGVFTNDVQM